MARLLENDFFESCMDTHFLIDGDHLSTSKSYFVASHLFMRGIIYPFPLKMDKTTACERKFSLIVATFSLNSENSENNS